MKYTKTELGQRSFKERSPAFSPKQRAAFILMDGKRSAQDVIAATAGLAITEQDIEQMHALGFITADQAVPTNPPSPPPFPSPPGQSTTAAPMTAAPAPSASSPQERYLLAYPIATRLTAAMGLRGFRLNLAVESASGYVELVALLPRIRDAIGADKCQPLTDALASPPG